MARTKDVTVNGIKYRLQSIPPMEFYEINDACGMAGDKRKSAKYADELIKNCVVLPPELKVEGVAYFNESDDISTVFGLVQAIESFLFEPVKSQRGAEKSAT